MYKNNKRCELSSEDILEAGGGGGPYLLPLKFTVANIPINFKRSDLI